MSQVITSFAFCDGCYDPKIPSRNPAPLRHRLWRFFYDRIAFAYDAVLHWADRLHIGSEQRVRREVIAGLYLPTGAYVVDVGCGTGANFEVLPADITYVGLDLSANMLRLATVKCEQQGRQAILIQADISALPLRKELAPLVIAIGVLQHVTEPQRALTELHRVASHGAQLLIIDERHAAHRIFPADAPASVRKIGEYFVMSVRKD